MASKASITMLTDEQQYLAIEQTLTRAGYDHEAYIEDRPKTTCSSLIFSMMNASIGHGYGETGGGGYQPAAANGSIAGGKMGGASSMCGGTTGAGNGGGLQMYSPVSPGSFSHKRYTNTVRSSTSSLLSLGRPKSEPPVMILPHYNSPYEALYFNQPDVLHFVGKDLKIGTVCISAKQGQGVMHFLVRTVLKFANIDIPVSYYSTSEFEQCRSLYPKKNDLSPLLHVALQQCLESIPENEVNRHQVVRHQSGTDHSVFVLDDPGWMQSPRYISNIVKGLEEIKQEGFTFVLKNLEAQMRPAALTLDIVIPNKDAFTENDQEKFWTFFNGLGDHIEAETYLPHAPKIELNMPTMVAGNKSEEQRLEAVSELIETETSYNKRMQDLVDIYLKEARLSVSALSPPMGKYEIRVVFSNIEQIVTASTNFLNDLREYQNCGGKGMSLGDICRKNLQAMECYKQYLMRYKRAQEMHSALTKKNLAYRALQDKCLQASGVQTVSNLLIEPTQRIAKYPLLFKAILSGTNEDSSDVDGLRDAAEIASQFAHMEKAKPEQRAEMLFNLRSIIENCPDSLLSQNRSIVSFMDGYEINLLTGEKGRPITIILFSDKVMIVRRPKGVSGDSLFRLKEDEEQRRRKEREKKTKDGDRQKRDDDCSTESPTGTQGAGGIMSSFNILKKDWKFMGWTDLLKIKMAIVEQTDPEGLFCITTRYHTETKDDLWETTRGIMPDVLDKRDIFISKFYETQSLAKASAVSSGVDHTSRLHVAELELFCNVFTENQYRDFKYKGDVSLFYTTTSSNSNIPNYPVDVTPFSRLPPFVGMIQATESGFRAVLRSKADLNGAGDSVSTTENANRFLDCDAFQIQITDLVANLLWTAYNFDPYQSAQLHISRVYMDTDYLFKTANVFTKAATLRTKGLKMLRETTGNTSSSTSFTLPARSNSSSSSQHHIPGYRHSGSFSPLTSPCDLPPNGPTSPNGRELVGRSNSIVYNPNPTFASNNSIDSMASNYGNNNSVNNNNGTSMSPTMPNKRFSMPVMMRRKRADSVATYDSSDSGNSSSVDSQLLSDLTANEQRIVKQLYGLVNSSDIEVLRLEILNYSCSIAFELLRVYLEEGYEHGPLRMADVRAKMGDCLVYQRDNQLQELVILRAQEFLNEMPQDTRVILGLIVSCYYRVLGYSMYEGYPVELAIKFCFLMGLRNNEPATRQNSSSTSGSQVSNDDENRDDENRDDENRDGSSDHGSAVPRLSFEEEQFLLMEIWIQYYSALWPELNLNIGPCQNQGEALQFLSSGSSTPISSSPSISRTSSLSRSDTLCSLDGASTSSSGLIRKVASMPLDGFSTSMLGALDDKKVLSKHENNESIVKMLSHSMSMSNMDTKAYIGGAGIISGVDDCVQAHVHLGNIQGPQENPPTFKQTKESKLSNSSEFTEKTLHTQKNIKSLRSVIETLRGNIIDEQSWTDGQLRSLAAACSAEEDDSISKIDDVASEGNLPIRSRSLGSLRTVYEKDRTHVGLESSEANGDRYSLQQRELSNRNTRPTPGNPSLTIPTRDIEQELRDKTGSKSPVRTGERPLPLTPLEKLMLPSNGYHSEMQREQALLNTRWYTSSVNQALKDSKDLTCRSTEGLSSRDIDLLATRMYKNDNIYQDQLDHQSGDNNYPCHPDNNTSIRRHFASQFDLSGSRSQEEFSNTPELERHCESATATTLLSQRVWHLQVQTSVNAEKNINMLDQCVGITERVEQEIAAQWEFMQRQYKDLANQLEISKAYQAKLEQENREIKDLYDEATEENNVMFEHFNEELENIFEAVNAGTITKEQILDMQAEKKGNPNMSDIGHAFANTSKCGNCFNLLLLLDILK
ncbi:hypothetical protein BGX27_011583 [Mortierella sp. AM989]|nr:hypothetical protein BGX27_011583 [Mortierella sp. AM989]